MDSELLFRVEAPVDPSKPSFLVGDDVPEADVLDAFLRKAWHAREIFTWMPGCRLLLINTTENPRVRLTIEAWDGPPSEDGATEWQAESTTTWGGDLEALAVSETGTGRWPFEPLGFTWLPPGPYNVRCRAAGRIEDPRNITEDDEEQYALQIWPTATDER